MKNTITYKNKVYRCRDASIEPLHIYENEGCEDGYRITLAYRRKGRVDADHLNLRLVFSDASMTGFDLIEVKPKPTKKEKLIEMLGEGKKVFVAVECHGIKSIYDYGSDDEGFYFTDGYGLKLRDYQLERSDFLCSSLIQKYLDNALEIERECE